MITFPTFRGGLSVFNPISLSPAVWYSDTGANPAQWDDISGNGRHATQATAGFRPSIQTNIVNGKQVRRFDGTDDFLTMGSSLGLLNNKAYGAILAVAKVNATTGPADPFLVFLDTSLGGARLGLFVRDGGNTFSSGGRTIDAGAFAESTQTRNTNWNILTAEGDYAAGQARLWVNNTSSSTAFAVPGNTSATDGTTAEVGRALGRYVNADIAEILVFNTALSTAERRRIEVHLAIKYNIAAAIP